MLGFRTEPLQGYRHNMTRVKLITLNEPFQVFSDLENTSFITTKSLK